MKVCCQFNMFSNNWSEPTTRSTASVHSKQKERFQNRLGQPLSYELSNFPLTAELFY